MIWLFSCSIIQENNTYQVYYTSTKETQNHAKSL